jgi:hypothetical protein
MFGAYLYKSSQLSGQAENAAYLKSSAEEVKEAIALQKIWSDKKTTSNVTKLKELIPASKVKWSKKGKKVTAGYTGLTPKELNSLTTKILNLGVEIQQFKIEKTGTSYSVEFKCKW